jgi:hypothetical protein
LIVIDGQKQNKNDLIKVDIDKILYSYLPATLAEKKYGGRSKWSFEITTKKIALNLLRTWVIKNRWRGWDVKLGISGEI